MLPSERSFWQYKDYADIRGGSLERGHQMRVGSLNMAIFASFIHCLPNIYIHSHTTACRWYECQWPWAYFKVIELFHTEFLKNGVWYGKSYYRLLIIGNPTLAFDWCHFWWPWSTFEGHFSLGCHFHVHFSYLWHAFASHGLPAIAELFVFTVRRYALHGLSYRNSVCLSVRPSVCPSVRLTHSWHVSTWFNLRSWFLHRVVAHHSSFWEYHVHPKIRRGSPRARALSEGGVSTNWRFSTTKSPYLRNGARYDKGYYCSLIGNRVRAFDWYQNQRPWFTLKWPWTIIMHSVALHTCFGDHHKNLNENRSILSAAKM